MLSKPWSIIIAGWSLHLRGEMGQGGCGLAERHCQLSAQKVLQVISFCILSNNNNSNRYQPMFTNLHGAKADYSKTKNDQNIHFQMAPRLVLPTARN